MFIDLQQGVPAYRLPWNASPFSSARSGGGIVTAIRATTPDVVQKVFAVDADGRATKKAAATIRAGVCHPIEVADLRDIGELLSELSEKPDHCLMLDAFLYAPAFGTFDLVNRYTLRRMLPRLGPDAPHGVHQGPFGPVAARLAAGIDHSGFVLLDADNWPGMPSEWAAMTMAERVQFLAAVVPGLDACERVEARSSSARAVAPGGRPGPASHGYIRVSHPALVDALRRHIIRATKARGLAAPMARIARDGSGRMVGREWRTVIDLAVMHRGRLIFTAPPCVDGAPGWTIADAGVRLVNEGGGDLDLGWLDQERPAVAGWRGDASAAEPAPMEWADAAPPHESPERSPTRPKGVAVPRTLPDPASAMVGTRNMTMFNYARFKAYAWADANGTPKVPFGLVLSWCREAIAGMLCDTAETEQQAVATARSITDWMPLNYEPGVGIRSAPKTEAEKRAARVAGRAQGAATQRNRTDADVEGAIKRLNVWGERVTAASVARLAKVSIRTAAGRLAKARAAATDHANIARHHMNSVGALVAADAPLPVPPSAAPAPAPLRKSIVPAFPGKTRPNCAPRATVDRAVDASAGLSPSWHGERRASPPRWPPPDPMAAGLHRGWHEHRARLRAGARASP